MLNGLNAQHSLQHSLQHSHSTATAQSTAQHTAPYISQPIYLQHSTQHHTYHNLFTLTSATVGQTISFLCISSHSISSTPTLRVTCRVRHGGGERQRGGRKDRHVGCDMEGVRDKGEGEKEETKEEAKRERWRDVQDMNG